MLAKLSTRRCQIDLEPMDEAISNETRSVSKSAVSRRFVAATESALDGVMTADLSELDLVAIMVDGIHFAQHLCVVAVGIGIDGTKHPFALVEDRGPVLRAVLDHQRAESALGFITVG
jgi:putative transposase